MSAPAEAPQAPATLTAERVRLLASLALSLVEANLHRASTYEYATLRELEAVERLREALT